MFEIDRIAVHNLFGIEGLNIAWYGILMALAIIVGVWVACVQARRKGYTPELIFDFMILAIPIAVICARIYYVAFNWDYYSKHPDEIIAIWNGGIAIYGAIFGGLLAGWILSRWRRFPYGRLMDFVAPGTAIGQAIGRWGNFVNQEAFGQIVDDPALQWFPYAVYIRFRDTGTSIVTDSWVQATFFYESMWDLGVFFLLLWYAKRARHDGNVFAMYVIAYGIGRLWIEGLRVSTLQLWPGMPVSQFVSLLMIVGGTAYILIMRKRGRPNPVYEGPYCIDEMAKKVNTRGPKTRQTTTDNTPEDKKVDKDA